MNLTSLSAYIAHLKGSEAESTEYYRTVLRLDPCNIVATSDLAHKAEHSVSLNIDVLPWEYIVVRRLSSNVNGMEEAAWSSDSVLKRIIIFKRVVWVVATLYADNGVEFFAI